MAPPTRYASVRLWAVLAVRNGNSATRPEPLNSSDLSRCSTPEALASHHAAWVQQLAPRRAVPLLGRRLVPRGRAARVQHSQQPVRAFLRRAALIRGGARLGAHPPGLAAVCRFLRRSRNVEKSAKSVAPRARGGRRQPHAMSSVCKASTQPLRRHGAEHGILLRLGAEAVSASRAVAHSWRSRRRRSSSPSSKRTRSFCSACAAPVACAALTDPPYGGATARSKSVEDNDAMPQRCRRGKASVHLASLLVDPAPSFVGLVAHRTRSCKRASVRGALARPPGRSCTVIAVPAAVGARGSGCALWGAPSRRFAAARSRFAGQGLVGDYRIMDVVASVPSHCPPAPRRGLRQDEHFEGAEHAILRRMETILHRSYRAPEV